jgi:hypothetical protein
MDRVVAERRPPPRVGSLSESFTPRVSDAEPRARDDAQARGERSHDVRPHPCLARCRGCCELSGLYAATPKKPPISRSIIAGSSVPAISRHECMLSMGLPTSAVGTPSSVEVMGPMVEPHGRSVRFT